MEGPEKAKSINGLVQVYTGPGKGKTTAALGLALRASGHNKKVCFIQFLKGGSYLGEIAAARNVPGLKIRQFGADCPWSEKLKSGELKCGSCRYCFSVLAEDKTNSKEAMDFAKESTASGEYDLVVLDEINCAMAQQLIPVEDVLTLIKQKNKKTELVLTGRNAPKEILDAADLVTEMKMLKHPMYKGVDSRLGIEF